MKILICNVGSTSLKFKLFDMPESDVLAEAKIERVRSKNDAIFHYRNIKRNVQIKKDKQACPKYSDGIMWFLQYLLDEKTGAITDIRQINAVGFKTVLAKGYYGVHELDNEVCGAMKDYLFIAPAHNGPYLEAIGEFRRVLSDTLLVGVFETAFHTTIPLERRMYAIPYEWYEKYGIMRMGYHGASHGYIARHLTEKNGACRIISCHLGGSSSVCAIQDGKSMDNSFGFSLQTGLPHAVRTGDLDPYVVPFLLSEGLTMETIDHGLSKQGGLLGISGVSEDVRLIEKAAGTGNTRAKLALNVLVSSIVRYIGAYYAELGGLDHLVFTGGIGENDADIRSAVCTPLKHMGIELNDEANAAQSQQECIISSSESKVAVHVIPANEEMGVAWETYNFCKERIK